MDQQWQCGVCGYQPKGAAPPSQCPVCGALETSFSFVGDPSSGHDTAPQDGDAGQEATAEQRWKCTVCGYIHTGPEPPDQCPVCGADKSFFIALGPVDQTLTRKPAPSAQTQPEAVVDAVAGTPQTQVQPEATIADTDIFRRRLPANLQPLYTQGSDFLSRLHAHPISVHIPNGVLPVAVLLLALAILFDKESFATAAFYNLVVVLCAMPVVMFTGYNDWQHRMGGNLTKLFTIKITCGAIVTGLALLLVMWHLIFPGIAASGTFLKSIYFSLHVVILIAGGVAGYYGGKLIKFPGDK